MSALIHAVLQDCTSPHTLGLHFSTSSNGRTVLLYISSPFSSLLPLTCLTSLTSHLHLCGLTFVHPFKCYWTFVHHYRERDEPIFLFRSSYSCKPISLCLFLSTCPTTSLMRCFIKCGLDPRCYNAPNTLYVTIVRNMLGRFLNTCMK